jgi:hypothetical protein
MLDVEDLFEKFEKAETATENREDYSQILPRALRAILDAEFDGLRLRRNLN